MSLRLKSALLLSVILVTALLAFGVGMHVAIDRLTRQATERALVDRARALVAANDAANDPVQPGGIAHLQRPTLSALDLEAETLEYVQMFQPRCSLTRALDHLRRLIIAGRALPVSDDGLAALRAGRPWVEQSLFLDELHLVYSEPIVEDQRLVGVAQVAESLSDQQSMLATLRDGVLVGSGAFAAIAFGLTWGLAGRALRPVSRLTREARAISAKRDFARRLEPAQSNDELGELTAALNAALGELHSAYRRAEAELAAQRGVVADVSHELRAPLTTVRGNLDLLRRDVPMDAVERASILRDAVDEIERMSRLVNEMLLLTRAGQHGEVPVQPVDVVPLAVEVLRKIEPLAHGRSILLDSRVPQMMVLGNADALNQVLLNLLDNAIKFTSPDGRIAVALDTDDAHAHIRVLDTGIGIPPEALPHVFERFYRADASHGGHGLGLAIAKTLVDAQGGAIEVRSVPGRGSIFTISLPLAA
jgi:signal transduction histidine kinase